jgi:hypothetical protein
VATGPGAAFSPKAPRAGVAPSARASCEVRGTLTAVDAFQEFAAGEGQSPPSPLAASRINAGRGKISHAGRQHAAELLRATGTGGGGTGGGTGARVGSLVVTAPRGAVSVAALSWLDKVLRSLKSPEAV